jgi:catechol 2,3-dioxygenase-like lactoylglutathione lyase family enzyme
MPDESRIPKPQSRLIPELNGLLEVAIYVDDLQRSVQFYRTILGFDLIMSDQRLCALEAGPKQVLLVCQRSASARLRTGAHDAQGQQHVAFAIPTPELDRWRARLEQQGITIEEGRDWERGGHSLYFRDPDGHLLELATPGVWSIY